MTLCNMSVEAGSRVGMVAPDETTFAYLEGRELAPRGVLWERALDHWRSLTSDADTVFDHAVRIDIDALAPYVTWGTTPEEAVSIIGRVPDPDSEPDEARRDRMRRSLKYMALTPGARMEDIAIDRVFIGSCTNGRLEDLRAAARVAAGRKVAPTIKAMVVPGSLAVRQQAEAEGLDRIFKDAGFEWREAGCSMCVAMNDDRLASAAPRPRTATSRVVKASAAAPI